MGTYCDAEDVQEYLQLETPFQPSSPPTRETVERFINVAEDEIDNQMGHAWRERRVVDVYHTARFATSFRIALPTAYIDLEHWRIRPFDFNAGDKLEVWNGAAYVNFLDPANNRVAGRVGDYFLEERNGRVYFPGSFPIMIRFTEGIRATYRYGEYDVWGEVHDLAVTLCAIRILRSTSRLMVAAGGPADVENVKPLDAIRELETYVQRKFEDKGWLRSPKRNWRVSGGPMGR